ncbi:MAG: GntR family transcriptional regulator [Eubacteriales bacterium]|nr:GntR family transcriptional regulator [Eubacteriales bacterium]
MIQRDNSVPLYLQLKNEIRRDIRSGVLKAGEKLLSEAEMQKKYEMSRVTVRNAMAELETEGYIIKAQGKGSFVAQRDSLRLPISVTSFSEDARIQGVKISSQVLRQELSDDISEMDIRFFGLTEHDRVMIIRRVRSVDGVPLVIEENHLPESYVDLETEDLTGSLYEVLQKRYNVMPSNKGRRSIRIIPADYEAAELLQIPVGTPVIESETYVFSQDGDPVHTVKDIVRGDNDRFFKWYV